MSNKILDQFSLLNKKSIVIGGAGDLGLAIVEALLDAGSETVIIDLDEKVFSICDNLKHNLKNNSCVFELFNKNLVFNDHGIKKRSKLYYTTN